MRGVAPGDDSISQHRLLAGALRGAASAAGLLESACAPGGPDDPLRREVVRGLARDLMVELDTLADESDGEKGALAVEAVEGALRAADVANLAACAAPELAGTRAEKAVAATHLAAGAARVLCTLLVGDAGDDSGDHETYARKDARGALWRARFAARQADEFVEGAG